MRITPDLEAHITASFRPLRNAAGGSFPQAASLSKLLNSALPKSSSSAVTKTVNENVVKHFATASVNMWLRSVHAFLVSAALTDVSPVWASVSGYYSSHYSVRAFAHALGFFQLFRRKRVVRLRFEPGRAVCDFQIKSGNDREHRVYWAKVKSDPGFSADPFFTDNEAKDTVGDSLHRDYANYTDHLPQLPVFHPLDEEDLKLRIERISNIEFTAAPIPDVERYPDLESVHAIAYHRLVAYRDLLDNVLGAANRFWTVNRNPSWARPFTNFQITETTKLKIELIR